MPPSSSPILFSASEDYLSVAMSELRAVFADAVIEALAPDLGSVTAEGLAIADVADAARATPFIFVRHLTRQVGFTAWRQIANPEDLVRRAWEHWNVLPLPKTVSLQVWSSGENAQEVRPDELRRTLVDRLVGEGFDVARSGRDHALSLVMMPVGVAVGFNARASSLSDWPGGQVRLAKPKGQVSRSEFKLEELFREFEFDVPEAGRALDLGASPGGWTRILRQRGLEVWAVDPADLHPSLRTDSGVHHIRTTASPFLASTDLAFDVVVNDMRMTPDFSSQMMLDAARTLPTGGLVIVTLKLTPHQPLDEIRQALTSLRRWYDIELVRQLHHNRHEVTVVGRKRAEHRRE